MGSRDHLYKTKLFGNIQVERQVKRQIKKALHQNRLPLLSYGFRFPAHNVGNYTIMNHYLIRHLFNFPKSIHYP